MILMIVLIYLMKVYAGQGGLLDPAARAAQQLAEKRITIWNRVERRKEIHQT